MMVLQDRPFPPPPRNMEPDDVVRTPEEAGHSVTSWQAECAVDGVTHMTFGIVPGLGMPPINPEHNPSIAEPCTEADVIEEPDRLFGPSPERGPVRSRGWFTKYDRSDRIACWAAVFAVAWMTVVSLAMALGWVG